MILKSINDTTEAMLAYFKKLVELEGAVIGFNHDLVFAKLNDIQVLKVRHENLQNQLQSAFVEQSGMQWTKENFKNYCESSFELKSAYSNLKDHTDACQKLCKDILDTNDETMNVAVKFLGGNTSTKNPKGEKIGKWGKKAKR